MIAQHTLEYYKQYIFGEMFPALGEYFPFLSIPTCTNNNEISSDVHTKQTFEIPTSFAFHTQFRTKLGTPSSLTNIYFCTQGVACCVFTSDGSHSTCNALVGGKSLVFRVLDATISPTVHGPDWQICVYLAGWMVGA